MKNARPSANTGKVERRATFRWFSLAGASLGLIVGLYEAALLYTTPRMPTLLQPDVRYIIWFLAPLNGLTVFTLLGAGLGLAAVWGKRPRFWRPTVLAAAGLGAVGFYAALAVGLAQVWVLPEVRLRNLTIPSACFLVIFASTLIVLGFGRWPRLRFSNSTTSRILGPLSRTLWVAMAACVSGLFLFAARFTTTQSSLPAAVSLDPKGGPNIVLIVLDTVRADELSAYGYRRPTTPNLDRLASRGTLFENAVAPSSWTLPSAVSILTGLLPHQHGANWSVPMGAGIHTLAEDLQAHGYETAGFNANPAYGLAGWGLGRGFEVYDDVSSSLRHNLAVTLLGRVLIQPSYQRLVTSNFFDRRNARQLNRDVFRWFGHRSTHPFFLFVNYFDTHYPYLAPPPYDRRFGKAPEAAIQRASNFEYRGGVPRPLRAERDWVVIAYDNCLAFLDDQIGQLLEFLAGSPEWANTIVIVTADHGEAFGEHGSYGHGINLYREALHVPLIFYGPGIPAGLRIAHIARARDLFQTVIDLASGPSLILGRSSLRRFWAPGFKHVASDDEALSELISVISLTTPEWHYLYYADGHSELFQWPGDLGEKIDLSARPEYQHTRETLQALLEKRVETSIAPWRGGEYLLEFKQSRIRSILAERATFSQDFIFADQSSKRSRPSPEDQELLNNLPYH